MTCYALQLAIKKQSPSEDTFCSGKTFTMMRDEKQLILSTGGTRTTAAGPPALSVTPADSPSSKSPILMYEFS